MIQEICTVAGSMVIISASIAVIAVAVIVIIGKVQTAYDIRQKDVILGEIRALRTICKKLPEVTMVCEYLEKSTSGQECGSMVLLRERIEECQSKEQSKSLQIYSTH